VGPATGQGFSVLAGDDAFIFPSITMGATGAIIASSGIDTAAYVAMVHCGPHQRLEQGRECAEALLPRTRGLLAEPNPAVLKAVLHAEGRIPTADVRASLLNCL
jgi:4-hydroxy-tetrahydrodipicolinate synthase